MGRVDAHQHFWRLARGDYGWLTSDLDALYRDFLPVDLEPLLKRHGIDATIVVQAAPSDAETDFMLSLADTSPFIAGVVGWVDFASPQAPARIASLARHPKLKGLRPMIQDIADPDWMLRADLAAAFEAVVAHDLVFEALVLPKHLENLATLLQRHPQLRVVVDHCAKPTIAAGHLDRWKGDMARIAVESAACCKLSGLVTEAGPGWTIGDLKPVVDHVLRAFGPERLIWGSDWPVSTMAASYGDWLEASDGLLAACTDAERAAVFGANATAVYAL